MRIHTNDLVGNDELERVIAVLLEDGQWYTVEKGTFQTSDCIPIGMDVYIVGFTFRGRLRGSEKTASWFTCPISALRAVNRRGSR